MNRFILVVLLPVIFFSPGWAGLISAEGMDVFAALDNCQMYSQNDWISADFLVSPTLPEEKSLDEISLRTGFFNWLDNQLGSQSSSPTGINIFVSNNNLKIIEGKYFSVDNFCPKIYFDRLVNKDSAEQSTTLYLLRDNMSREQNTKVAGNWFYDGNYLSFTPTDFLLPAASYRIVISSTLKDVNENYLSGTFQFDFFTIFTTSTYAVVATPVGISLTIPENSLPVSGAIFLRKLEPDNNVKEANSKMRDYLSLGYWQIVFYDSAGSQIDPVLVNPARLNISYSDSDNDDFPETSDGKTTNVLTSTLAIYYLDENKKEWQKLSTSLNSSGHLTAAEISHFSIYGLFGKALSDIDNVFAYPVPYVPADPAGKFNTSGIYFTNLPYPVKITVIDNTGTIVKEVIPENPTGEYFWDVKDSSGRDLPSGAYFYIIKKTDIAEIKKGKLLIIR